MAWLLNCYRCGRWVSKRRGGDPDVLEGEVGYPRCHQCVRADALYAAYHRAQDGRYDG